MAALAGCSKKEEASADAGPASAAPAAVEMKEPGESAAPSGEPKTATAPATGSAAFLARFDGYSARVAGNMWQPVALAAAEQVATFALIAPQEPIPQNAGLTNPDGAENLALGIPTSMMRTAEGFPLQVGGVYSFAFTKGEEVLWSVLVSTPR